MIPQEELRRVFTEPSDIRGHLGWLHDLVVANRVETVIEVGVRQGRSTVALLAALDVTGGALHSIDIRRPKVPDCVWAHPRWRFYRGRSLALVGVMPFRAGLVLLDGSHYYAETVAEILVFAGHVAPGGVLALHDIELQWHEGQPASDPPFAVEAAVTSFRDAEPGLWGYERRSGDCGLGVLTRR